LLGSDFKLISAESTLKFSTNAKIANKQEPIFQSNDPAEQKTADTQLIISANVDLQTKSPSNSLVLLTVQNETNKHEGKKSKEKERKDKQVTKDIDVEHKSADNETQNRSSVRFDVNPLPHYGDTFGAQDEPILQSASSSAIQSPASPSVESPSFASLPGESRKRRSKSRSSDRIEKLANDTKKESSRNRSKSKTERKPDSSPDSGHKRESEKDSKKRRKEEEERKKKEEEEVKKKKKEEEERKKKDEKKEKSERRKSRRGLVPSLSLKVKDKDLINNETSNKTLSSQDSKDDLHVRPKSSVAQERGGIKSKKSMPSLKLKSISPRERKGSNSQKETKAIPDSSSKPLPISLPYRDMEPKSELPRTDRSRTRSLHRSASTENVEKQTRTARITSDTTTVVTPDGAAGFRIRKRSLSTNELKGDGTDPTLASTEPISIGQLASESKQREDTYANLLKKSIREILLGTSTKIEREELTKVSGVNAQCCSLTAVI